ncbi:hypothetical protein HDU96_007681 [Phlyctochytrium bullatum]|nr:hypothetical protein HDU96_007681 [Phlyctochytrium bullatum]
MLSPKPSSSKPITTTLSSIPIASSSSSSVSISASAIPTRTTPTTITTATAAAAAAAADPLWIEGSIAGLPSAPILVDRRLARTRVSHSFAERAGLALHIHSIARQRIKVLIAHDLHVAVAGRTTLQTALVVPDDTEPAGIVLGAPWCKAVNLTVPSSSSSSSSSSPSHHVVIVDGSQGRQSLPILPAPSTWSDAPGTASPTPPPADRTTLADCMLAAKIADMPAATPRTGAAHRASVRSNASSRNDDVESTGNRSSTGSTLVTRPRSPLSKLHGSRPSTASPPTSPRLAPLKASTGSGSGSGTVSRSPSPVDDAKPHPAAASLVRTSSLSRSASLPRHTAGPTDHFFGTRPTSRHLWTSFSPDATPVDENEDAKAPRDDTPTDTEDDEPTKMWETIWARERSRSRPRSPVTLTSLPLPPTLPPVSIHDMEARLGGASSPSPSPTPTTPFAVSYTRQLPPVHHTRSRSTPFAPPAAASPEPPPGFAVSVGRPRSRRRSSFDGGDLAAWHAARARGDAGGRARPVSVVFGGGGGGAGLARVASVSSLASVASSSSYQAAGSPIQASHAPGQSLLGLMFRAKKPAPVWQVAAAAESVEPPPVQRTTSAKRFSGMFEARRVSGVFGETGEMTATGGGAGGLMEQRASSLPRAAGRQGGVKKIMGMFAGREKEGARMVEAALSS